MRFVKPLCLFAMLTIFFSACKLETKGIKAEYTALTESVYASLSVKPLNRYYAYAGVGGIVKQNLVTEGELVTEGQVLVQIDNTNPALNAENARLAYEQAKENYSGEQNLLDELKNQMQTAKLKLKNDSLNYFRQKRLKEQNIGSEKEYENIELAYQLSKNQLSLLKINYSQTKSQLETNLRQAQNSYQNSLKTTKDYAVKSEIEGKVYELMKERGEIVLLQEPLAMLGSRDSFLVEMMVDEVDIPKLMLDQKVLIRLDAYGKEVFEGSLSKIYPKMDSRSQTFKVEAVFVKQPDQLYPGLTGEANIIIQEKEKVLTIPFDYLQSGSKVQTKDGLIKVETGIQNFDRIEILSGLDTNTYILKAE